MSGPERSEAARLDPVAVLEERLGFTVPDRPLALAALTHKSYVNEHREEAGLTDNERLEFLGDAVIDLAVSHRLMERFPAAREGELSKMRAAVVDEQGLSEMARALGLGELLRLGRGEELTGGRQKASLLADAMEAVVAAVFLGSGLAPVLVIVDRFLGEAFARAVTGTLDRDYKTQLQELSQSRLRSTPRYRVVAEHGPDHSKIFEVETDLRGEVLGRGAGRSKKDAEQAAARLALDLLGRRFGEAGPVNGGAAVPPSNGAGVAAPEPIAAPIPAPVPPPVAAPAPPPKPEPTAPPEPPPAEPPIVAAPPAPAEAPAAAPPARKRTRRTAASPAAAPPARPRKRKAPVAAKPARKGSSSKR